MLLWPKSFCSDGDYKVITGLIHAITVTKKGKKSFLSQFLTPSSLFGLHSFVFFWLPSPSRLSPHRGRLEGWSSLRQLLMCSCLRKPQIVSPFPHSSSSLSQPTHLNTQRGCIHCCQTVTQITSIWSLMEHLMSTSATLHRGRQLRLQSPLQHHYRICRKAYLYYS